MCIFAFVPMLWTDCLTHTATPEAVQNHFIKDSLAMILLNKQRSAYIGCLALNVPVRTMGNPLAVCASTPHDLQYSYYIANHTHSTDCTDWSQTHVAFFFLCIINVVHCGRQMIPVPVLMRATYVIMCLGVSGIKIELIRYQICRMFKL